MNIDTTSMDRALVSYNLVKGKYEDRVAVREAIIGYIASLEDAGYVIVPIRPTANMVDGGLRAGWFNQKENKLHVPLTIEDHIMCLLGIYKTMIAVAMEGAQ